jgi:2,4-dienoyl-CoA reductase (NADPH2)
LEEENMGRKILEPIEVKGMKLKNRLGFSPWLFMPAGAEGHVTDLTIRWFEEKAKGGIGFIMTGTLESFPPDAVPQVAAIKPEQGVSIHDDKYIPGWARLVDVIHSHGVKIGAQFAGMGPMMAKGPSASPFPDATQARFGMLDLMAGRILPVEEVSVSEIQSTERVIAAAAGRAKRAGFDCVEIHSGHGGANLHGAFISPYYNRRTDQYGGSWMNRLRLHIETIEKIREAVGADFPILIRLSADELLGKAGITIEDTVRHVIPILEKAGIDGFDISQGSVMHSPVGVSIPPYYPRGYFIHFAEAVKKVTNLPVIAVGRILDLGMAERFLEEGKADMIYMGSQLCADPETPKKYFEGRAQDIRKCIGCKPMACGRPCSINYESHDAPIALTAPERKKKVLIIGGGVAGLEAARIAALRGHKVTLMEREPEVGGMVATLALNPLNVEFRNIVNYLSNEMRKLRVDVRVCREAATPDIDELKPDVVILATGSSSTVPEIAKGKPGVMTHEMALKEPMAIGQRVIVWGFFGAELAISLAEQGKDVTLIGKGGEHTIGSDIPGRSYWLLRKLTDVNVPRETPDAMRLNNPNVMVHVTVESIAHQGMKVVDKKGTEQVLPFDTIILSRRFGERKTNDSLFDQLKSKVAEAYKIGDCKKIKDIHEAILSANEVARKI